MDKKDREKRDEFERAVAARIEFESSNPLAQQWLPEGETVGLMRRRICRELLFEMLRGKQRPHAVKLRAAREGAGYGAMGDRDVCRVLRVPMPKWLQTEPSAGNSLEEFFVDIDPE